ncbi:RNA pseudouridine synthase 4, mitochondrial [Rutidosis leptorrhynchoides]|uniref:RNA pseudouridine synthase 4, mitochondrial n=1 Tax=Rutidosis leptorrhynchoides TaxID=125765 RepID=UPI003A99447A
MAVFFNLRRVLLRSPQVIPSCGGAISLTSPYHQIHSETNSTSPFNKSEDQNKEKSKWLTLPPYNITVDAASLGKVIAGTRKLTGESDASTTTAIKWVMRCCPQLPRSLVQKLFRLRQVRRQTSEGLKSDQDVQASKRQLKRVSAKDLMNFGDTIHLPITVQALPTEKAECHCNEEELKFLHDLELYKDSAIIVINKPPGMPVQGGIGIKTSLDELAGTYMRYDSSEPPRLVHRLDRDSSGILVLGRTQLSATLLHSVFREKTSGASNIDLKSQKRFLQRKYWALVLGAPRRPQGLISVPLGKVVMDDGRSERITVVENGTKMSSQHAITEYRVLDSNIHGLTWLELSPLTGRKHQLRVHCAEVLGTPIVGDYKYGWQAHRKWNQIIPSSFEEMAEVCNNRKSLPFGLDLESGSITNRQPNLHLHCKKMVLPDVSYALKHAHNSSSHYDFEDIKSLKFDAPLPPHMQKSWDILCT